MLLRNRLFLLLLSIAQPSSIIAHEMYTSYSQVDIQNEKLTYTLTLDQTELENIFELDSNNDKIVAEEELIANLDNFYEYFEQKITIISGANEIELSRSPGTVTTDNLGNVFVNLIFLTNLEYQPYKLIIALDIFHDFGPLHKNLAKITNGDELQQAILTVDSPEQDFLFSGEGMSAIGHAWQFLKLGTEHIFVGYDHILFLMGLIIIGGSFFNLIKIVTSFTIAHSMTLILAALQIVALPSRLVESVIALSIVYIALENFFIKKSDDRWLITFVFGLMHGFGFAGVLQELGLPSKGLVVSLLAFNVGVEIGQIAIIAVTFPIIYIITKTRWQRQMVYGLSSAIMVFGLLWFFERAFGFDFPIL